MPKRRVIRNLQKISSGLLALSKIDLVTHLVYEMPDLQGIVGREYALESGEKTEIASAIGTQYLPKESDGRSTRRLENP